MTPKRQKFVAEYLIHGNATKAATNAGYSARSASSIGEELLRFPEVSAAVKAGRLKVAEDHGMTLNGHLQTLKELRDSAAASEKFAAAVAAEIARGKASGFYVERVEMEASVRGSVSYKANLPARA